MTADTALDAPTEGVDERGGPPGDGTKKGSGVSLPDAGSGSRTQLRRSLRRRRRARRAAIGAALVFLVAAVPTLGYVGYRTVADSRGGQVLDPVTDPAAAGYQALVEPTPTALVVHADDEGDLAALTVLSLGPEGEGGGAIFVPVDTVAGNPENDIDRLATAYDRGLEVLRAEAGAIVGTGFGEVIEVDDARWAELLAPVGPLSVRNPEPLRSDPTLGESTVLFEAGDVTVAPDEAGRYLSTGASDDGDLDRVLRQQLFWQAWVDAVEAAGADSAVPGEGTGGLRRFVGGLASGPAELEILSLEVDPISSSDGGPARYLPDISAIAEQLVAVVPFPTAPVPGGRVRTRLLSGVEGSGPPEELAEPLVLAGAEISVIGNAGRFGAGSTVVEYYSVTREDEAERLVEALGAGEAVFVEGSGDSLDVTVVVGRDLLDEGPGGSPG
ncbi:hypothetical protein BH20ACT2_BH20ACT2_11740 [soil metagenome]